MEFFAADLAVLIGQRELGVRNSVGVTLFAFGLRHMFVFCDQLAGSIFYFNRTIGSFFRCSMYGIFSRIEHRLWVFRDLQQSYWLDNALLGSRFDMFEFNRLGGDEK